MCMVKEAQGMELLKKEITVVYDKMFARCWVLSYKGG